MALEDDLIRALDHAETGDWDAAHRIVQRHEGDPLACWIHALLHKIEPDEGNARYWYRRAAGRDYADFADPQAELAAIRAALRRARPDRSRM